MTDTDDLWLWESRPQSERQAQKQAVDAAEAHYRIFGSDDDDLAESEAERFMHRALSRSAFSRPAPVVLVDLDQPEVRRQALEPEALETVTDQPLRLAGLVRDGVIHLDPALLDKRTALHELAHYIAPRASHGPVWCRIYVDLVAAELGHEAGIELLNLLNESGALVADRLE